MDPVDVLSRPHRRIDVLLTTPSRCYLREDRQKHVADHVRRVASVDDREELFALPAISFLSARPRDFGLGFG